MDRYTVGNVVWRVTTGALLALLKACDWAYEKGYAFGRWLAAIGS